MNRIFCTPHRCRISGFFSGRLTASGCLAVMKVVMLIVMGGTEPAIAQEAAEDPGAEVSKRIDFGSAQIMGQSNTSGAVYLMNRKPNEIESMLTQRKHYREEILAGFEFDVDDRLSDPKKKAERNTSWKTEPSE